MGSGIDHSALKFGKTAKYADLWPVVLVALILIVFWILLNVRAERDDRQTVKESFVNHGNVARIIGVHVAVILDEVRSLGRILNGRTNQPVSAESVKTAIEAQGAFLRVMKFDASGKPVFSSGQAPEPWLIEAARHFAAMPTAGTAEQIIVGAVPPEAFVNTWNLPIFYRPGSAPAAPASFMVVLLDLGYFPKVYGEVDLGTSGEIILATTDGREIMRIHSGSLTAVESIINTERFHQAFSMPAGTLTEITTAADERLYAYWRVPDSPFAVLVSRTRDDVLSENSLAHRRYWQTALLLTVLVVGVMLLWLGALHRRQQLIARLRRAQESNAELIKQIEKEKEAAYHLATHDKLTGLPNRMMFAEIAQRHLARVRRLRGNFAVLFIDLDRFKPINDTYGHKAGDQLLVQVAQRLHACVRQTDLVSRFGGDEFVALVTDLRNAKETMAVAEKFIASLSEPFCNIAADDLLYVTPSIGIALYPNDATEIDALVRQADNAMYQAKQKGRATFAFADHELNRRNEMSCRIEAALPAALQQREIRLVFQPKVSLQDSTITGFEALARWRHPQLGEISPADFIPVAEKCGCIDELGEYVIEMACQQMEHWWRSGLPLFPVAINIAPHQLRSPRLYDVIASALERHGISPHHLEIEITETGLLDTSETHINVLNRLSYLGVRLAIDDFGMGFSGLNHLRVLPAKHLKIDRSFVQEIGTNSNDATIVSNIISLSHNLHLLAIAEGVETAEQVKHLRSAGCDQAQGFFFSYPLEVTDIEPVIRRGTCCGNNQLEI